MAGHTAAAVCVWVLSDDDDYENCRPFFHHAGMSSKLIIVIYYATLSWHWGVKSMPELLSLVSLLKLTTIHAMNKMQMFWEYIFNEN